MDLWRRALSSYRYRKLLKLTLTLTLTLTRRYRKLLKQRIDWADDLVGDDDDEEDEEERELERKRLAADVCKLVWEGFVVKSQFRSFRVEAARQVEAARKILRERGCEHYLDMALRFGTAEDESSDDDDDDDDDESESEEEEAAEEEGTAAEGDAMAVEA